MANDPLVNTQWLADHLKDPRVKILDASFKMPGVLPIAGAAFVLLAAAVVASLLPAARAARVDVMQALCSE